jgi:CDP-diacylglycerol--glycerol-3-phosphate 3-phosphatidyltransferase
MQGQWKNTVRSVFEPVVTLLVRLGIGPDAVTVTGLVVAVGAGVAAGAGRLRLAGACLILSALCDLLDGQIARRSGRSGPAGALLDSCLDRLAEGAVFLGLIIAFGPQSPARVLVTGVALIGSYMVSYTRARAEGLGFDCQVGWMERPERLVVLIVALLWGGAVLDGGLVLLAVLSLWTFWQRLRYVTRVASRGTPDEERPGR